MWTSHPHLVFRLVWSRSSTIRLHQMQRATTQHSLISMAASSPPPSMDSATPTTPLTPANTGPSTTGNLQSLASTFLTFTASGDWVKIFVFGWILETCRRYLFHWRDVVMNRIWITATFDANDFSHGKLLRPHSLGSCLMTTYATRLGQPGSSSGCRDTQCGRKLALSRLPHGASG